MQKDSQKRMQRREYLLDTKDFEYAIIDPINPKFVPEPLDAEDFQKFNPNHDELGRFASNSSGASSTDYQMAHRPQGIEGGAPLHDLTGGGEIYPADVYSAQGAQYYGTGYKALDVQAHAMIQNFRGKPDAPVTIYRAIPKDATQANINAGDWVTPIREYAVQHGQSNLNSDYKILSKTVRAKEIFTSGDSWMEWGYAPQTRVIKFAAGLQPVLKYNQNHDPANGQFSSGDGAGSAFEQASAQVNNEAIRLEGVELKLGDAYAEQGFVSNGDAGDMQIESEVTYDQQVALANYQAHGYEGINKYLRSGDVGTMWNPADLAVLNSRIASIDSLISKVPQVKSEEPIYRVFSASSVMQLGAQPVGTIFEDKGYMSATLHDLSTTAGASARANFGGLSDTMDLVGRIIPNGHYSGVSVNHIIENQNFAHESEFLLPRGTQLAYLGTEKVPTGETILNFKRMN